MANTVKNFLSLIKFSHTIFALPFALIGFALGTLQLGQFYVYKLLLVLGCMIFGRSAAMAFNRYLDRDIDEANPRTKVREIPAGAVSPRAALTFVIINCLLFCACAFGLNWLCFWLSPIALLVILGYSYTKRFTAWCHLVLGLGLALAPIGAYIAVTGQFGWHSILYGFAVLFWVSGFDIIYALQDAGFDKSMGLRSIPVALGKVRALRLSEVLHILCALAMGAVVYLQWQDFTVFSWLTFTGLAVFLTLLLYQHRIVQADDLSRVNLAFFTTNGIASVVFGALLLLDVYFN